MDILGFEVTKREIIVSIIFSLFMVSIGFFIANAIHDSVTESNEKYFKALKVDNKPEMFDYAIKTEVGDLVSYGEFKANQPVSDEKLKGDFFSILKVEEHYVMKTRTVTYTDSKGNTHTKVETYWEWEEVDRKRNNTETFSYLGYTFPFEKLDFNFHEYNKTIKDSIFSDVRYVYYTIPTSFNGTLYSKAKGKDITENTLHPNEKLQEVVKAKETEADNYSKIFWLVWSILIALLVTIFCAMENRILNGRGSQYYNFKNYR